MGASGLGSLLVKDGLLTEADRLTIKKTSGSAPAAFAKGIVALGLLSEDELATFLTRHTRIRLASRNLKRDIDTEALACIDPVLMTNLEVVPLRVTSEGQLEVAMADPLDATVTHQLEFFAEKEILPVIATISQIRRALSSLVDGYKPYPTELEVFLANHADSAARQRVVAHQLSTKPQRTIHQPPPLESFAKVVPSAEEQATVANSDDADLTSLSSIDGDESTSALRQEDALDGDQSDRMPEPNPSIESEQLAEAASAQEPLVEQETSNDQQELESLQDEKSLTDVFDQENAQDNADFDLESTEFDSNTDLYGEKDPFADDEASLAKDDSPTLDEPESELSNSTEDNSSLAASSDMDLVADVDQDPNASAEQANIEIDSELSDSENENDAISLAEDNLEASGDTQVGLEDDNEPIESDDSIEAQQDLFEDDLEARDESIGEKVSGNDHAPSALMENESLDSNGTGQEVLNDDPSEREATNQDDTHPVDTSHQTPPKKPLALNFPLLQLQTSKDLRAAMSSLQEILQSGFENAMALVITDDKLSLIYAQLDQEQADQSNTALLESRCNELLRSGFFEDLSPQVKLTALPETQIDKSFANESFYVGKSKLIGNSEFVLLASPQEAYASSSLEATLDKVLLWVSQKEAGGSVGC